MKVTVIIPVYNQIKYLERCIESVFRQTYKDLEIILVDDGSNDGSEIVCEKYKEKDERIIVIHKENGGLSSARNLGIDIATGEYITFLDSDDYLATDFIRKSIELCADNAAQISIMRMQYIAENINDENNDSIKEKIDIFSSETAIENSLLQELFSCCAPGKMYHKMVFNGIRFPLMRLSEDLAVCHLILNKAKKIIYSNVTGYYYRQQSQSIMHVFNPKRIDALLWAKDIEMFCAYNYPAIVNSAKCRTFNVAVHLILALPEKGELPNMHFEKLWCEVKRTRRTVLLCKKVRFREKAAAILSYGGQGLLKKIWNSKLAIKQNGN